MFAKEGLYNDQLLHDFLMTELVDIVPSQRFVDIPLTNVESGAVDDFYQADLTNQAELLQVLFGNFAYPGFFAPEAAMGTDWFTGGLVWDIDLFSVVNQCLLTHAMEDIVVDVVLAEEKTLNQVDASQYVTYQNLLRAGRIIRYEQIMDGLLRAEFAYPNVTFRNIIAPSATLPQTKLPLTYTQTDVDAAVSMGYSDAVAAATNPGEAALTLKYFGLKTKNDRRIKGVSFEKFLALEREGVFSDFSLHEDAKLQRLFQQ